MIPSTNRATQCAPTPEYVAPDPALNAINNRLNDLLDSLYASVHAIDCVCERLTGPLDRPGSDTCGQPRSGIVGAIMDRLDVLESRAVDFQSLRQRLETVA